jgi:hypothetical protein
MQVAPEYRSSQQRSGKAKVVSSEEIAEARKKRDEKEAAETGRRGREPALRDSKRTAVLYSKNDVLKPFFKIESRVKNVQ